MGDLSAEDTVEIDFNDLERAAARFMSDGRYEIAAEIYHFMADGDSSLDAGYLGHKLGICYEKTGKFNAAKYWYGRAVEENPEIIRYSEARTRLKEVTALNFLKENS